MTNEELFSEIKNNFKEIERADKGRIPILIKTIIRQIPRLKTSDNEKKAALSKFVLHLKNLISSENQLAEMAKSQSNSVETFGESFLESLGILKNALFKLIEEIDGD